jgi:hypothetical protein
MWPTAVTKKIASDYIVSVETDKTVGIVREGLAKGAFGILEGESFWIADAHCDVGSLFCQRTNSVSFLDLKEAHAMTILEIIALNRRGLGSFIV